MWRGQKVAVVVPAYREERILPRTLARIPAYVDVIIVVDDGSPDQTFEVARQMARVDERVQVVRLGFNQGVGAAIGAGYERALREGAQVVAVMAADDQMDPADLPRVLEPVVMGRADYSKGDRLRHHEARRMPWVRRVGTGVLARATSIVAGRPGLRDTQCGYTAISAWALRELDLDALYPRYGYPNDLILRLVELGAEIEEPVVRPIYADEVSGLKIHKVIGPITGILLRGVGRRLHMAGKRRR